LTVRRALKHNIYLHVLIYLAIFFGVHMSGCWLQTAFMGHHEMACNAVFEGKDPLSWRAMGTPVGEPSRVRLISLVQCDCTA
jgi:hypothetical protein